MDYIPMLLAASLWTAICLCLAAKRGDSILRGWRMNTLNNLSGPAECGGASSLVIMGRGRGEPHSTPAPLNFRRTLERLWFWLTHSIDCSWCRERQHQAWIPLGQQKLTKNCKVPRISHTICPRCLGRMLT